MKRHSAGWRRIGRYRVILFFLLGLFAIDRLIEAHRNLWRAYQPLFYRDHPLNCRQQLPDLVLIGGSTVMCGFDPQRLAGLPWHGQPLERPYNFGLPLATVAEVFHAAEHGLGGSPRLVVYGICASDFNEDRCEPLGPIYLMAGRDFRLWYRLRGPRATWWSLRKFGVERAKRLWPLWYYRESLRLWAADQADRLGPGSFPESAAEARYRLAASRALCEQHGYLKFSDGKTGVRLDRLKAEGAPLLPYLFLENYSLGTYRLYLDRLLDWANGRGIEVVLVDMPVCADLEAYYATTVFAVYRQWLREVECRRKVPILRPTREALGLEDKHFGDLIHLNYEGAARLSDWLRHALAELGAATESTHDQENR